MQIPDKRTIILIAELFKGFDDPTRVQILSSLIGREMCVNEIAEAAELSQSATSHELRILKRMRLVKFRREGKKLLYSLADDHVLTILKTGLDYVYSDT